MAEVVYPRITIEFCTQCKWTLRAAYFAQELFQTFSNDVGEIALIPATGGLFAVKMQHKDATASSGIKTTLLWDRKTEGGFPEPKELKRRVRDIIEPGRDLGHVDGHKKSTAAGESTVEVRKEEANKDTKETAVKKECEDCK